MALDGITTHEGTHVQQNQSFVKSVTPKGNYDSTLIPTVYGAELPAYQNQATVWQQSGQSWSMNGKGQYTIEPKDDKKQVNDTINRFLADPANGYGVSSQKQGPKIFGPKKDNP
jgi:hypothetical protein